MTEDAPAISKSKIYMFRRLTNYKCKYCGGTPHLDYEDLIEVEFSKGVELVCLACYIY